MHPVLIIIPAAALIFGPRLWVRQVLKRHNKNDASISLTGAELVRELLDRHGLNAVRIEVTDIGDHYDPQTRTVRLTRDKMDRRSLTALTTGAHEVGHALQDASGYPPFVWRLRLARVAQVTGQAGSVMLIAVPLVALATRAPVPPMVVGCIALTMIGVGVVAQMAALPAELDASFRKALPMLRAQYIDAEQEKAAREILTACSLTYVASSLAGVLNVWPWVRGIPAPAPAPNPVRAGLVGAEIVSQVAQRKPGSVQQRCGNRRRGGLVETLVRRVGKPVIRQWIRLRRGLEAG
jgi:Zn-dependent membrane protease YugP